MYSTTNAAVPFSTCCSCCNKGGGERWASCGEVDRDCWVGVRNDAEGIVVPILELKPVAEVPEAVVEMVIFGLTWAWIDCRWYRTI